MTGIQACKDAQAMAKAILPNTLPSVANGVEIRFDTDVTTIHIDNMDDVTKMAWDVYKKINWPRDEHFRLTWLCPKSYLGQGIHKLAVSDRSLMHGAAPCGDWWTDSRHAWVHTLRHMFKDLETIICLVNTKHPANLYDKEDYRDSSLNGSPMSPMMTKTWLTVVMST